MAVQTQSLNPGLSNFLSSLRRHPVDASVDYLITLLKRGQIWGSRRSAIATANLLINVVASFRPSETNDLLGRVRSISSRLVNACPNELAVGNIARRVLGLVHDSTDVAKANGSSFAEDVDTKDTNKAASESNAKEDVLDGIRELLDELDQADKQISEYASEHIFPEDTILTIGSSRTVQRFLLDAAKRRKFRVIVVEGYPNDWKLSHDAIMSGVVRDSEEPLTAQNRLKTLTTAGIIVTLISDAQVFAMMPMVKTVVVSAQGILSNGGFVGNSGSKSIASCARHHNVPVIALGAIYRLSPIFPYNPKEIVQGTGPPRSIRYEESTMIEDVQTSNFISDYVGPDMIGLFVTNVGATAPNQVYRLAKDHYRSQDVDL